MKLPNFRKSYIRQTWHLMRKMSKREAMAAAVGSGGFDAVGKLEYYLLKQHGLEPHHTVYDIGCGSGRLAFQLKDFLHEKYYGIDVVKPLYKYAEKICNRPDWTFSRAPGLSIPAVDNSADFICFFSVFTHLMHEESYIYLRDAARVLKPGGKIIFSYLDFSVPSHWGIFENMVKYKNSKCVLNQFMDKGAIKAWTDRLDLRIELIEDGDTPHIPIDEKIILENGSEMVDLGNLGQSVCVLTK